MSSKTVTPEEQQKLLHTCEVDQQQQQQQGGSWWLAGCGALKVLTLLALAAAASRRLGPLEFAASEPSATSVASSLMEKAMVETLEDDCGEAWGECLVSRCCQDPKLSCFAKNAHWAACMPTCKPGIHENDGDNRSWICERLWSPASVRKGWEASEAFAWKKVGSLTNEGKMALVSGAEGGHGYAGFVNAQSYIWDAQAALTMNDGPQGYNAYQERLSGLSTQYPCLLAVAASFDTETSHRYAVAIAEEFVAKASNVMLGPDVEVTRTTLTGRSFETISGEDPFLGATLVQPFVRAVQDFGIITSIKHWLDNNQEIYRQSMNVEVGDRAQHEIYMPVFKAAFEAGAGAVMCSYNKVYGTFACENERLLKRLLRDELNFKGFVVSDWGATHDGVKSAKAGLDVEMPHGEKFAGMGEQLAGGDDELQKALDQMAVHVVSAMHFVGQFDGRFPVKGWLPSGQLEHDATSDAHRAVAEQTILDSAVLIKNEKKVLPLALNDEKKLVVAMIGKFCDTLKDENYKQGSVWAGGGSGYVDTLKGTTPLGSVRAGLEDLATIVSSDDGSAADGADVAVICVAAHGEEGWDRKDFLLEEGGVELIQDVRQRNKNAKVVVIAAIPGAVATEWMEGADAVLLFFMPGEQIGPAVVKLLSGEASPSGRLPISFPTADEDRFTQKQYPGWCDGVKGGWCDKMTANFSEDVLVGYRWNDAKGVPSAYPFGFGLTYTEFTFSDLKVDCSDDSTGASVAAVVSNLGDREAAAVPQLYVGFPSLKPVLRQLRGFQKVTVKPGYQVTVTFRLTSKDWSFYDVEDGAWKTAIEKGEEVVVSIGASSADLQLHHVLPCGLHAESSGHDDTAKHQEQDSRAERQGQE